MREKIRTKGDLSIISDAHQQAIKDGDDHWRSWQRNVADKWKDKSPEEIKSALKRSGYPFAVCFEHWINDFNMGTGIRNANAFNAKEVFYVGDKKWDKRAAVGVYNYTDVTWLPTIDDLVKLQDRYTIVGIDNVPGSVPMMSYSWPRNTLMVFGEESVGLTPGMKALCRDIVHIEMYGTVRSFNCGTASGIAMYSYLNYQNQLMNRIEADECR